MNVKNVKVSALKPYPQNAKRHDETQIKNVAESIKQYGFVQPIVIDKDNVVVIGHCRLLAAKKLNMENAPCVMVDELTDEQVKALRLIDNKTNESEWDIELLTAELDELDLSEFDIDWGVIEENEQTKNRQEILMRESISVVIECYDEEEAELIFEKLSEEGYKCRISTL